MSRPRVTWKTRLVERLMRGFGSGPKPRYLISIAVNQEVIQLATVTQDMELVAVVTIHGPMVDLLQEQINAYRELQVK